MYGASYLESEMRMSNFSLLLNIAEIRFVYLFKLFI